MIYVAQLNRIAAANDQLHEEIWRTQLVFLINTNVMEIRVNIRKKTELRHINIFEHVLYLKKQRTVLLIFHQKF
jgi:ascorbate-specific PTS system EIIC-type component UlaA